MVIDANGVHFAKLNDIVRQSGDKEIVINNALGHRYIASGLSGRDIRINGTPGNALGCYLDGSVITVNGNAQDATGDTMNNGTIYVHGSAGDACGYGMRGGKIFIRGNVGYRAGIHMKEYKEHKPVIIVGGKAGDFLGEYQAGGLLVVLGIGIDGASIGSFCGTGMHGGKIFVRNYLPQNLPPQVSVRRAKKEDLAEISEYVGEFCKTFGYDKNELLNGDYFLLTPNTKNPYHQIYTQN